MIKTIPIAFHGGHYGTFLEWALHTLTTDAPVAEPFTDKGNSHQYNGRHVRNLAGWREYLATEQPRAFVRLHPKVLEEESLSQNLDEIMSSVDRMIYIHPDEETMLLTINNSFTKIWDDWWANQFETDIDAEKIYSNWPDARGVPITEIPTWIKREFLSFYLMPQWQAQVEWNHLEHWSNPGAWPVLVKDILYDFENTVNAIRQFCGLTFTKDPKELLPIHSRMIEIQKHKYQDRIAHQIVDSVTNDRTFDWSNTPTTLATESWIQWQLRNLGYEIRCHGLDTFPTNSVQLQNLLYKI